MSRSAALRRPAESISPRRFLTTLLGALRLRHTRQQLARLDPHLLRDIGLTADQARQEASRPVWDAPQAWLQRD